MTALITLTTAGADTGPFDLYSDADAFVTAFETGVSKVAITAGYTSTVVPVGTTVVRVMSNNGLCSNYIDITATITTTTTTTIAPTTTTTSTLAPTTTTTTTLAPEIIILAYSGIDGPDACLSYSLEGVTTYYAAPGSVIANDTIIYTDPELTMVAPNGYYSSGTDYYDILTSDGVLANETPCPAITTTTTTTVAATTTTTTTSAIVVNTYLIEGIWEVDDPAHPAGGFINYIDASGTPVNLSGLWVTDSFTITAQSIGTHAGVTITLIP
jgi:hypothetical protein